ncbi:hypothetical protein JB92DRAFT_850522 [Gautieria morchelliformis]|nr:hypothetical protein JB92DRAFT_850522 [Gautieria morchelliformis]
MRSPSSTPHSPRIKFRHTRFYFSDGSAIFLVGKKLYKLHMSLLQPHSPICKRLFSIHGNTSWHWTSPSPSLISSLRDILELATFLEWEDARCFAINAMDHVAISPAMRLSLAVRFGVEEWIGPAYRDLMAVPTHELTREHFTELGDPLCHLIVTTQAAINHRRLVVADNLLKLPHSNTSCGIPTHMCRYNLEVTWRDD